MSGIDRNGWTALPRDINVVLNGKANNKNPEPILVDDIEVPKSAIADKIYEYAKRELPVETFNHSMRVFYYGQAIARGQFPDWKYTDEVYFIICLLHDIGTTDKNMPATNMSFEFYGGMIARDFLLKETDGDQDLADAVAEAIFRHQDIGTSGKITTVGLLIQLATILDNMGEHAALIHCGTIDDVVAKYPRLKWSSCFARTIRKENSLKPWSHTTSLGEDAFPDGVFNNKLMNAYE